MPTKEFLQSDTWKSIEAYAQAEGVSALEFLDQLKTLYKSHQEERKPSDVKERSMFEWFEELAIALADDTTFTDTVLAYFHHLFQLDFWEGEKTEQLFKLRYSDYPIAKSVMSDIFNMPGLYFWGHENTLLYIGKTGKSFKTRCRRYLQGERSQTGLAESYRTLISHEGATADDFPTEIREWYRRGYGNSTVRLDGAIKFAQYGLEGLWLSILPSNDPRFIEPLEEAMIRRAEEVLPPERLDLLNRQYSSRRIKSSVKSDLPSSYGTKLPISPPPTSKNKVSDKRTQLPLKSAYLFLQEKRLYQLKQEIKEADVNHPSYTSSVRRGWVIKELKARGYYEEFKDRYWPFGNSLKGGQTLADRYVRIYEEWRGA